MQKTVYPYIALAIGVALLLVLLIATTADKQTLPLLALLLVSEFGFIVTSIGAIVGLMTIKSNPRKFIMMLTTLVCAIMSVKFVLLGLDFWPL